jgi:hypothetical protein
MGKLKVVAHEGMSADILYLHIRERHPELKYEKLVATLRELHKSSHRLIPSALEHYHEAPHEIASAAEGSGLRLAGAG